MEVAVAAVLLALLSVGNSATERVGDLVPLSLIDDPAQAAEIPASAVYSTVVLGVVGPVVAYGLWTHKRWSAWFTIFVSVLNILLAVPGMFFAPTVTARVLATVGIVGFALSIALVVLPASRRAFKRGT